MKKTKKVLLIENVFNNDIEVLLRQWYLNQRMSDSDIESFLNQHNIKISLLAIWRWRKQSGITSRTQPASHKVYGKTPKMLELENAMGGQECAQLIPWLWSLGKTSGEIIEFLNGFLCGIATDALSPRTLSVWLRMWGCRPNEWSSIRQSNVRRRHYGQSPETKTKISQGRRRYFKDHPEATVQHSKDMISFYRENPKARLRISQTAKQRWARQKVARFCPLISENLAENLCKEIQDSDCKDCSFYAKEARV